MPKWLWFIGVILLCAAFFKVDLSIGTNGIVITHGVSK